MKIHTATYSKELENVGDDKDLSINFKLEKLYYIVDDETEKSRSRW